MKMLQTKMPPMVAAKIPRTRNAMVAAVIALGLATLAGCAHRPAASVSSSTYETRRQIARELVAQGNWQPAFSYVEQLHREKGDDAETLVLRATIYRERNLLDEAEGDLREAIRLAPALASARAGLGIIADMRRRPQEAEENLRMAVKLEPRNAAFLNNLGFSLFLHGKIKEAITQYEQSARLAPTVQRTRTNLGFAYAARGDLQRAAREFEMGGTPVEAKINLGFAYERRGDMANAYVLYEEAHHMDPRSIRARANLTHAAQVTGRPLALAAEEPAPRAAASSPSNEEVAP
jgi:Flp pilus assembly protein TadD